MWIKFNTIPTDSNYGLFYKDDQFHLSFDSSTEKLKFGLYGDASFSNKSSWTVNRWYHVVVTFDDSEDTVKFFIDGKIDSVDSGMTESVDPSSESLYIGKAGFNGVIDEVFFYDRPLSYDEVNASYDFYRQEVSIGSTAYLNIAPSVNLTSLQTGDIVGGKFFINGTSFDSNSLQNITGLDYGVNVTKVEINIDNGTWTEVSGTTSWEWEWDAKGEGAGNHTINVRSFDGKKYSEVDSVIVLVVIIDIEIDAVTLEDSVNPEESAIFTVNLINDGSIYDFITLEATNLPSGWVLSDNNLTTRVSKYSTVRTNISIIPPKHYDEGDYVITIKGTSNRDSRETSFANVTVTVLRFYDFDLESPLNQTQTPRNSMNVQFNITNQGNYKDRYSLEAFLDKTWSFVILDGDLTSRVDPGETITVTIQVTIPDKEYWQTTANLELNATGGYYDSIEILESNSTYLIVDLERRLSISIDSIEKSNLPSESVVFDITVENIGNYRDNVSLELNEISWVHSLSTYEFEMTYLESETVQLTVHVGAEADFASFQESLVTAVSVGDSDVEVDILARTVALQFFDLIIENSGDKIEEPYRDLVEQTKLADAPLVFFTAPQTEDRSDCLILGERRPYRENLEIYNAFITEIANSEDHVFVFDTALKVESDPERYPRPDCVHFEAFDVDSGAINFVADFVFPNIILEGP